MKTRLLSLFCLFLATATGLALPKVLILDTTVYGGMNSLEAQTAIALGYEVEVVTAAQWQAKSAAEFADYRAIILGDPSCGGISALAAAEANRTTWGPVVNGNVIIIGTDPTYHQSSGGSVLTTNGIRFAANQSGKTGLYITLSCYYHDAPTGTSVPVLDQLGAFTVRKVGCYNRAHIVATHPVMYDLTDTILSDWSCSVHESFNSWPASFLVLALAEGAGTAYTGTDLSVGTPYILARGEGLAPITNRIALTPFSASNPTNSTHMVCATVVTNGTLAIGVNITFTITSGPNVGTTDTIPTDNNGVACFTYPGIGGVGIDTIIAACVDHLNQTITSNPVTKNWFDPCSSSALAALIGTVYCESNKFVVNFNEIVSELTATNLSNYILDHGFAVTDVSLLPGSKSVIIKADQNFVSGTIYTLQISGVTDLCGRYITPNPTTLIVQCAVLCPEIRCPSNIVVQCNGPGGAMVHYEVYVNPACTNGLILNCFPPSDSIFSGGTTLVTCTALATNGATNTCSFTVTVTDLIPPLIECPSNIVVNATSCTNAIVNYMVTATDNCTVSPAVVCIPPPGYFELGTTPVHCVATDDNGNTNSCDFTVTVLPPLQVLCPPDITVLTCSNSAEVWYAPQVLWNGNVITNSEVVCSPPAPGPFPIGTTMVTCTATNSECGSNMCSFTITVLPGNTPPIVICASNKTVSCGLYWNFDLPDAHDGAGGTNVTITVLTTETNGSPCDMSVTRVWQVTDVCGNSLTCTQTVMVVDTTPPVLVWLLSQPGQNLVPNPGFETYTACPDFFNQLARAVPWFAIAPGNTPDFFHTCASPSWVGVPANFFGTKSPQSGSGSGYAGLFAYDGGFFPNPPNSYREFIETRLLSPLVYGQTYEVSFYVSLADNSSFAVDNLGAYFSVEKMPGSANGLLSPVTPQVRNPDGSFLSSKTTWMLVKGTFQAQVGGEYYLTIGNFYDNTSTPLLSTGNNNPAIGYYHIDDVTVREIGTPCPTNKTLYCPTNWSFDEPIAYDACCGSNVTISVDTVTNGDNPQVITRTWWATDCCNNSNSCSQTITIYTNNCCVPFQCPTNIVVDCTNDSGRVVYYPTQAVAFTHYNPPSGSTFLIGTTPVSCIATDACGNVSTCVFAVTVRGYGNNVVGRWVKSNCGNSPLTQGNAIAVDQNGNAFVGGTFLGTIGTTNFCGASLTWSNGRDGFLAKFDTFGNLLWIRRITGPGDETVNGVAVDSQGNCYVVGAYSGTGAYFPVPGDIFFTPGVSGNGGGDIFLAKYTADGDRIWWSSAGGTGADDGSSVAVDDADNCYITGVFSGTADFGTATLTSSSSDCFIAKWNSSGVFQWATNSSGTSGHSVATRGVVIDSLHGKAFITGVFSSDAQFGSATLGPSSGFGSAFVAQLIVTNASPTWTWARQITCTTNCGDQDGRAIGVDDAGNCYFTAYFRGTAKIGAAPNQTVTDPYGLSLYEHLVGEFDGDGNPVWLVRGLVPGDAEPRGLAVDHASGDVYVAGFSNGDNLTVDGGQSAALFKYDFNGNLKWTQNAFGSSRQQVNTGRGVALDSAGCVYVTGSYTDNSFVFYNFLDGVHSFSAPSGTTRLFVAKYCPACSTNCVPATIAVPLQNAFVSAGPSPANPISFTVTADGTPPLTFYWYRNGVPLSGGSYTITTSLDGLSSTLRLTGVPGGGTFDSGPYSVYVGNQCCDCYMATSKASIYYWFVGGGGVTNTIGHYQLGIAAGIGIPYRVEYRDNLNSNTPWQFLTNMIGTGTNPVIFDPNPNPVMRFYRIPLQPDE